MQTLRSVLFTGWMFLTVPVFALGVIVSAPLPYRFRFQIARAWVVQNLAMLKWLCGLTIEVRGLGNVPDEPYVAMVKHSSALETLVNLKIFSYQSWVLKRELMWIPFFGWGVALLKPIAVRRGGGRTAVNQLIRQGVLRLRHGISVMVFPEGTRVAAGQSGRYGVGGAALALRAGARILPVAHNAGDYWPRRGWVKWPGTVTFVIGEPIVAGDREPRAINAEVKAWIDKTVDELREHDPRAVLNDARVVTD
ncbi:MAG: lysophospholipid acyltransferase family protein [Pseudomonadota bacterium]